MDTSSCKMTSDEAKHTSGGARNELLEKAQYQGAPFADVFQVELILSEEDSDRACIVDVGDTGMSYVIP